MALQGTGNALGEKIAAIILHPDAPLASKQEITAKWRDIGTAIVNHIIQNLEIPPGVTVATTGTAAAQTGATTGPGKTI